MTTGYTQSSALSSSGIRWAMSIAADAERSGQKIIHLEVGEPHVTTPQSIIDAAHVQATNGATRYTDNLGTPALRQLIAEKYNTIACVPLTKDNVVVTVGAIGALFLSLAASTRPGDHVLLPEPGWSNYGNMVEILGRHPVFYRGYFDSPSLIDEIEKHVSDKTTAILINSPCNPTGQIINTELLKEINTLTQKHSMKLISDEVYDQFCFAQPTSALCLNQDNTIIVSSLSKSYAMTGWRIGWAIANESIINSVYRPLMEATSACASSVSQAAAIHALQCEHSFPSELAEIYRANAQFITNALDAADIEHHRPQGGFFVWCNLSEIGLTSHQMVEQLIREEGVAVTPGTAFGPFDQHIRLSFATNPQDLQSGVIKFVDYCSRKRTTLVT